jgi:DNA replicative helicase MCM subunit Mcm2 (Cdc46/Mcm family)
MPSEELIGKFRKFIEKYYYEALLNCVRKGHNSIHIDFSILSQFDFDLSEQLINSFREVIDSIEEAIKLCDIPEAQYPIHVRITNLPKSAYVQVRHIRSKHLAKLL